MAILCSSSFWWAALDVLPSGDPGDNRARAFVTSDVLMGDEELGSTSPSKGKYNCDGDGDDDD